jgi:RNA polymerase sigma factor (sigma-70 family)
MRPVSLLPGGYLDLATVPFGLPRQAPVQAPPKECFSAISVAEQHLRYPDAGARRFGPTGRVMAATSKDESTTAPIAVQQRQDGTATSVSRRSGNGAITGTGSVPPDGHGARHDEYAHLVALHRHYAQSAPGDSQRQRLRDELISGYLPVAKHIARRFAGRGEPLDDLVQVATVGLIRAVDRFQPDRGSDFLSFAVPTITGEIRSYFRDFGSPTRIPRRLQQRYIAIKRALPALSQHHGRAPRPSEIAEQLEYRPQTSSRRCRLPMPTEACPWMILEAVHRPAARPSAPWTGPWP